MSAPWRVRLARPSIGADEEAAALRVLRSGWLTQGPEVTAFEEELAAACGRRWAVAVSSGTAALHLALWALDVGPGETVRVPAFTFPATANAVRLLGAAVELVDVNAASWCMRLPERPPGATDPRSLVVHQFGFPAPSFERDVSDAACAVGVPRAMQGACACLSFHPRKVLTTGEGGAVVGDDEGLRDRLRALRSHGLAARTDGGEGLDLAAPGLNYRIDELSAAIGRVQLRRLPELLGERRALAERYRRRLQGVSVGLQSDTPARAWQTFAVLLPDGSDRVAVRARLAAAGIETQVASYGLHTLAAYRADPARFPVADALHRRALALPLWNGLDEADVDRVAEALAGALAHGA
jgi:dTDP-4-amino-4,6-dideoxygalactose transaminase